MRVSVINFLATLSNFLKKKKGASECSPGWYFVGTNCSTPTIPKALVSTTWSFETDTASKTVLLRKVGDSTSGIYIIPYTSAADTYYIFTYYNGGTLTFDQSSDFFQNQYTVGDVTFGSQDVSFVNYGGVYSKSIANSNVTKFQMTITAMDSWICFGIVETTTFEIGSSGFGGTKKGPCADSGGTVTFGVTPVCSGCVLCDSACAECTGTTNTECLICNTGYYSQPSSSTTCLTTCPVGYYPDSSTLSCKPCHSYCSACTGSLNNQCTVCKSGYFLQVGSTLCLNYCPSPSIQDPINNICKEGCDASCSQCTGPSNTECSACNSGYFLQPSSTTCLNSCPTGYWKDSTNRVCAQCNAACSQCTGSGNTQCQACNSGYFLQPSSTTCLDSCPSTGYFKNSTHHMCDPCDESCLTCTGPAFSDCPSCSSGYYLQPSSTSCKNTCPDGYYKNSTFNTCPGI